MMHIRSLLAVVAVVQAYIAFAEPWQERFVRHFADSLPRGRHAVSVKEVNASVDVVARAEASMRKLVEGVASAQLTGDVVFDNQKGRIAICRGQDAKGRQNSLAYWVAAKKEQPLYLEVTGCLAKAGASEEDALSFVKDELAIGNRTVRIHRFGRRIGAGQSIIRGFLAKREYLFPFDSGWFFLVDGRPHANWSHPCRYVFVSEDLSSYVIRYSDEPVKVFVDGQQLEMREEMLNAPKDVKKAAFDPNAVRAAVSRQNDGNGLSYDGDTAHSYALVISGGADKSNNHSRYWGDVVMIYSTLRLKYNLPKDHITVCMSDGKSNGSDMHIVTTRSYMDSPRDLDGDGTEDVDYDARGSTIESVVKGFADRLTESDQLFVFITDHGSDDYYGNSYFVPWDSDNISADDFADWLSGIKAHVAVAMETCYSGGFVDPVTDTSRFRAVATACRGDEPSSAFCWSDPDDEDYGEYALCDEAFDYCNPWAWAFTTAIRGCSPAWSWSPWQDGGREVTCAIGTADKNADGRVSFEEAASCAKEFVLNTTRYSESLTRLTFCDEPQYGESQSGDGSSFFVVKQSENPVLPSCGAYYAQFTGINVYQNSSGGFLKTLSGCVDDAWMMLEACCEYGNWGDTWTLTDDYATEEHIRDTVHELADLAVSGDTVLLYHSSHGSATGVATYDSEYDYSTGGATEYDKWEMAEDLGRFRSGVKVVVIVDACESGGLFNTAKGKAASLGEAVRNIMREKQRAKGPSASINISADEVGWITAADAYHSSYDSTFTPMIYDGWTSWDADANADGKINFYELYDYAKYAAWDYDTVAQCCNEGVLKTTWARGGGVGDTEFEYEVMENDDGSLYAALTAYNGNEKTVEVPSSLDGYSVEEIASYAFDGCSAVEEVRLPECCSSLYPFAFSECPSLRKVSFSCSDDVLVFDYSLSDCPNAVVGVNGDVLFASEGILGVLLGEEEFKSPYTGAPLSYGIERVGYTLDGWFTEADGKGTKVDVSGEWETVLGFVYSHWVKTPDGPVSAPVLSPTDGQTFTDTLTVTCTCGTDGATIRYTTDGTDPTESSATWPADGLKLEATTTVKVRGYKTGMTASAVVSATYAKEGDGPGEVGLGVGAVSKFEISGSGTAVICGVGNLTWEAFSAKDGFGNRCYVNEEIVDAEKSAAWEDDNYWCTALNQMDMLVWTGWAADVGYTDVDDLADYFRNSSENLIRRKPARQSETDFPEEGTYGYAGVFDWFADQAGGTELALKTGEVGEDFPRILSQAIDGGNGLVQCSFMFDCNTRPWLGMKDEITHSVLICGYVCKGTPSASNPTALTGLFLIDSDNDQYTGAGGASAPNSISYHKVTWDSDSRRYVIHDAWGRDEGWSAFADGDYMWTAEYSVLMAKNVVTTGNDDFADAAELVGDRGTATGSNVGATRETGEPYHCGSAAAETVWWKWTASEDGTNTVTTEGSAFDTVLAVYTGEDVAHLTLVEDGENDDADADAEQYWSRVSFEAEADTTYYIAVTRGTEDTDGPGAITLNWSASCGDCELEPEGSYTITFDSGEAKSSVTIKDIVADVGAFVTLPECTYEYEGHYFDGWFCEETKETYGDSRKLRAVRDLGGDGDTVKLVAQWRSKKKGSSYTVVFKSSNEDDADSESDVYSSGVTYWLNANPFKAPDGLKPAGWICPKTGKVYGEREKVVDLADVNKAVTLVAQWEGQSKAGSYKIVFAPGEGGSGTMVPLQVETNKTVKLPKCAFVNKNDAVTFSQWKSDAGKTYSDEAEVIGLAKAGETVTLTAQWGCAPFPTLDDGLLDDEKKDVPIGFAAYVYDGYLIATNEDSSIAGVVTVKVDKKGKATATVTRIGVKKLSYKSQMPIANGEVDLVCTKDPAPMHLAVYAGAVEGSCGAYQVRCRKNVAKENPAGYAAVESKVWAVALKADELKAPDTMRGYASLTVTGSKKGKVKISGFLPDGTKVSATVQAAVGADGIVEIPVVAQLYSGKVGGISLALQIDGKTGEAEVRGAGKWKSLAGDLSWDASQSHCTSVNVSGIVRKTDMFVLEEQPEQIGGMNVATQFLHSVSNMAFMGKKWMIAKGGKIKLMGTDFVDQAASPNPGGLTLSYTPKTGAFKGKYAIYVNNFGKSKKLSATINGVVVGESGYGTAVIKKQRSIPVGVEEQAK